MATLSSSSTLQEIENEYLDTVSYEEDSSISKARRFITACEMLLLLRPSQMASGGQLTYGDQAQLARKAEHARQFVAAQQSGNKGRARFADFSNLRD